jgi:HK97 family phage prohead protease
MFRFQAEPVTLDAAPGENKPRTITGVAVPWDKAAVLSGGETVMFRRGAFDVNAKAAKLVENHDLTALRGTVTELVDADDGLLFTATFARTAAADDAVELVKAGAYDAVSVGATPIVAKTNADGVIVVEKARLVEISLVAFGAYDDAKITEIAAAEEIPDAVADSGNTETITEEKETSDMTENTPVHVEATIPTAPIPAAPKRRFDIPTVGEYMAAYHIGGDTFRNVAAVVTEFAESRRSAFEAAAGDTTTTNTPLFPVPLLGPVFEDLNYIRPTVAAVGARAMPDGGNSKTFIRPTWTTHTSVAAQSAELDPVSATTPVIAANVVSKQTVAGGVTLSIQDVEFTNPAAMDIIVRDLVGQYMLKTDDILADAITNAASASGSTWTVTANDPSTLIAAMYDAAGDILTASNFLPDTMFVSVDVWKKLGGQLDGDKRPVFPYTATAGLMGVNGMGSANITVANTFNPFGLNLVADRNFATGTLYVAKRDAIEFYEQVRGIMSVEVPGTLARTMSYYGYVAPFVADADLVKYIVVA